MKLLETSRPNPLKIGVSILFSIIYPLVIVIQRKVTKAQLYVYLVTSIDASDSPLLYAKYN